MEPGHTFRDTDLAGKAAAGYFRVSSNPDETETRSVDDQQTEYWPWVKRTGVVSADPDDVFADDDRSASIFAAKQRENFARLRAAIEAGRYQVVWFWSTSRQTRGDVNIYELAKVSAEAGALWCVNGQLLNPANEDDLLFLGIHHLMDRQYAWRISKDSARGHKSIAYAGKPSTAPSYGYRRLYDHSVMVKGKPKFVRDIPNVFDGNGRPVEDSPAWIVRDIYDRINAGDSLYGIARSLEARGIPTPRRPRKYTDQPCRWTVNTVWFIATSPAYIGRRIYHAESGRVKDRHAAMLDGVEALWDPLVGEELWWAVQRKLREAGRRWPGRGEWKAVPLLLAGVARCGKCATPLHIHHDQSGTLYYMCGHGAHVSIRADWLDAYTEDRIVSWLADPQVHAYLWGQRESDTASASAARALAERLEHQLEECRAAGEDPDADAVFWERRSRALAARLAEARELARPVSLSPVLSGMTGPDAADKWWALRSENIRAAGELVKAVADVRVYPGKQGGDRRYRQAIDPGRISWKWLAGPGEDQPAAFGEPRPGIRDQVADVLRADPERSVRGLAREMEACDKTIMDVRGELEDAGEIPVIRRRGRGKPVNHGYRPASPGPS
jgi:DNA invertase Pin-like site-specific DNA recombinase